jgi:ABC-type uncharacterized transport system ATPase subunit
MSELAIELKGIDKSFGLVHANRNINLKVRKGTIHGIIGENGAGKSTLMSILYGFYQADHGDIVIDGKTIKIRDPNAARSPPASAWCTSTSCWWKTSPCWKTSCSARKRAQILNASITKARAELKRLEKDYALEVDPDAVIEELPVGLQQRVEILKALYRRRRYPDPRRADGRADAGRSRPPVPHPRAAEGARARR